MTNQEAINNELNKNLNSSLTIEQQKNKSNDERISSSKLQNQQQQSLKERILSSKSTKSIRINSAASIKSIHKTDSSQYVLNLPVEIICLIMSFMNLNDRKNASLISKKWRNSFEESFMLKDVVVKANNNLLQQANKVTNNHEYVKYNGKAKNGFDKSLLEKASNLEFNHDIDLNILFQENNAALNLTHLRQLSFDKCENLSSKLLFKILKLANNIESLALIQCDSLFMSGFLTNNNKDLFKLNKLNELSLSKNRYLNDYIFNMFIEMAPNLSKIDLSYCYLTKTQFKSVSCGSDRDSLASISAATRPPSSSALNLSNAIFTFETLCKIIEINALKIKSLNLSGIDLLNKEENILKLLLNIDNLCLNELIIENLNTIRINTICKILNKQNKLNNLSLNNSMQVQDDTINSTNSSNNYNGSSSDYNESNTGGGGYEILFTELFDRENGANNLCLTLNQIKLKKLYINRNCYVLLDISKIKNLTYLDLSYCTFNCSFTNKKQLNIFINGFANNLNKLVNLETLILSYCDFLVNDYLVKKLCLTLNKLKYLDIRNCAQINDETVHYISQFLVNLEYLDLSWCRKLTDYAFNRNLDEKMLSNRLKYETSYDNHTSFGYCKCPMCIKMLTNCNQNVINRYEFPQENENDESHDEELKSNQIDQTISLKNLKKLRILRLESCINVSDFGLENGVPLEQLYEFDIKLCTNIKGHFIKNFASNTGINGSNLNLKIFNINQCVDYKYDYLIELLKYCKHLKQLHTSGCPAMTNQIIDYLLNNKIILNKLDVSYCSNVNEATIDAYEQFLFNQYLSREFFIDKRFVSK